MKNKNLLTESEIRKFMKFANIETLTESFIENNASLEEGAYGDEAMDETVTEEAVEETVTEEVLSEEEVDVKDLVTALMDVIEDKTGVQVSVEDAAVEPGEEMPVDDEEMPGEPGEPGEMDMGDEEMPSLEPDAADDDMAPAPSDEEEDLMSEMVNKITSRVAARLLKENKK